MGLLQDWIRNRKEKKRLKTDYERARYIEEDFEERKLSSNERELTRWQEQERQKLIKSALEKIHRQQSDKTWKGIEGNPLYTKNVVNGQKELFKNNSNIFTNVPDVIKQKKLFYIR